MVRRLVIGILGGRLQRMESAWGSYKLDYLDMQHEVVNLDDGTIDITRT
jgi:hypothetical protein